MALTHDEVRNVALLARLELTDDEIDVQARHINGLLLQFEALQSADVEGVEPTSHILPMTNVLRDDAARPSLSREAALANAPEARDGVIVVPRIVEG